MTNAVHKLGQQQMHGKPQSTKNEHVQLARLHMGRRSNSRGNRKEQKQHKDKDKWNERDSLEPTYRPYNHHDTWEEEQLADAELESDYKEAEFWKTIAEENRLRRDTRRADTMQQAASWSRLGTMRDTRHQTREENTKDTIVTTINWGRSQDQEQDKAPTEQPNDGESSSNGEEEEESKQNL